MLVMTALHPGSVFIEGPTERRSADRFYGFAVDVMSVYLSAVAADGESPCSVVGGSSGSDR